MFIYYPLIIRGVMYRSNVGLATLLIILTILPSSMSIPFQSESQPLIQEAKALNVRNIETNINPPDLEFDAKFIFDQKDRCRDWYRLLK